MQKEKYDRQKQQTKGRLVARGFQESLKPQSDSPTASKEIFKMLMVFTANSSFKLASVDIRASFMQSKVLYGDVYIQPPEDFKKLGIMWRLKKPWHRLDDASHKFWLRFKEVLTEMGFWVLDGDEAFYFLHKNGKLQGAVITHVENFKPAGTEDFIQRVLDQVEHKWTVSMVEKDTFRFTRLDVKAMEDGIEISMNDYMQSLKDIKEIQ